MRPVIGGTDAGYAAALVAPHDLFTRVDLLLQNTMVTEDIGGVIDGTVVDDRTAPHRCRLDIGIEWPDRIPGAVGDQLAPTGYELRVMRGIVGAGYCVLGTFPIQTSALAAIGRLTRVTAIDRSAWVAGEAFDNDVQLVSGTPVEDAIMTLVQAAAPWVPMDLGHTGFTIPAVTFSANINRWEAIRQLARSAGREAVFDGNGVLVLRVPPTAASPSSGTLTVDQHILDAAVTLDRGPVFNRYVVKSRNASLAAQYTGEWVDDDPSSSTYYGGTFGRKTAPIVYSEYATSNAMCVAEAEALGSDSVGIARTFELSTMADATIESADVLTFEAADMGVTGERHLIDVATHGLGPEAVLDLITRSRV